MLAVQPRTWLRSLVHYTYAKTDGKSFLSTSIPAVYVLRSNDMLGMPHLKDHRIAAVTTDTIPVPIIANCHSL